jgi:transcriptional regulator with XRE-family HTH domain
MPRRKTTKAEKILLTEGWKTFGLWLRSQREVKGFTQQQVARAAKMSRRQWMRYEQGSKVLSKRFPVIAKTLNIPLSRVLYLAGYETPPRRNDSNVRLKRIHDMLRAGSFDFALEEFLMLYDRIRPTDRELNSDWDGLTAPNFATAVILLDGLPKWLFEAISKCMQKRFSQQRNQSDMDANLRALGS